MRRRPGPAVPNARILLVTISDADIEARRGPSRTRSGTAIETLRVTGRAPSARHIIATSRWRRHGQPGGDAHAPHEHVAVTKFAWRRARHPPPSALRDTEQVGFNDIVVDRGGIVRGGCSSWITQRSGVSFAFRLATLYLGGTHRAQPDGRIEPAPHGALDHPALEENDGGYVRTDARGYQMILDFEAADKTPRPSPSPTFSPDRSIRRRCAIVSSSSASPPPA